MAFPPSFLEEIRQRVALPDVVMRKVRLVKRGREYSGLCPFHNEKSPSFTVNEDKGFFHCFGCGAHGDVIGFVMRIENLGFPEAVERLAGEAGLEVPRATPEERQRVARQKTLHEVLEAASDFYEAQLLAKAGEPGRDYLARRGLGLDDAKRFRLGFAPGGNTALKTHLLKDFPPSLVEEAGLIRVPEDGRESFDYFRNRVMYPILDRGGRVVAFGGRVIGDAKPKYLNSPETALFQKGRILYGLAWARAGIGKGAEAIVTEGYMDVIALHRAGFEGAVAPLGTALTEGQLEELWKLAAEPILCFDGDAAGQRAATRALERALPLLTPGRSLRFATLTGGEDPDTLIGKFGAGAMRAVLDQARPLAETLWRAELAAVPLPRTPEQRAGFLARLLAKVRVIADEGLRREYESDVRNRFFVWKRAQQAPVPRPGLRGGYNRTMRGNAATSAGKDAPARPDPLALALRRRQEVLLRLTLDRPELLDELCEDFAAVELPAPDLDKLRQAIINIHASVPGLDAGTLKHNLSSKGFNPDLERLCAREVSDHVGFAVRDTDPETARRGWLEALGAMKHQERAIEVERAVRRFEEQPSDESSAHATALPLQAEQERQAQMVESASESIPEAGRR
jgi:DNA primase